MPKYDGTDDWKIIPGYTRYSISPHLHYSSDGNYQIINNDYRKTGRVTPLFGTKDKDGYLKVCLKGDNGERKQIRVNRLVAYCFIKNDDPNNQTVVNHINEIKKDNDVSNLEWCTVKYNSNYGTAKERKKETNIKSGLYHQVSSFNITTGEMQSFDTIKDCADHLGIEGSNISMALNSRRKSSGNYVFLHGRHTEKTDFSKKLDEYYKRSKHKTANKEIIVDDKFIFSSIISASKFIGRSYYTVSKKLSSGINVINNKRVYYYKGGIN